MQTIQAKEYRRSFRVDPWDLERLVHILGGDEKIARVHVEFGDGSSTMLRHAGELSDLPNQSTRPIERLWFECLSPAFTTEAEDAPRLVVVEGRLKITFKAPDGTRRRPMHSASNCPR